MLKGHIMIEGPDGTGKSSLAKKLLESSQKAGIRSCTIREPGSSLLGEEIRKLLITHGRTLGKVEQALLFQAARISVWKEQQKLQEEHDLIIQDRGWPSTVVYQKVEVHHLGKPKGLWETQYVLLETKLISEEKQELDLTEEETLSGYQALAKQQGWLRPDKVLGFPDSVRTKEERTRVQEERKAWLEEAFSQRGKR